MEVNCFLINRELWASIRDGRQELLSLTLYHSYCMMKCAVYLSDTEGLVPPSASERGVTNR